MKWEKCVAEMRTKCDDDEDDDEFTNYLFTLWTELQNRAEHRVEQDETYAMAECVRCFHATAATVNALLFTLRRS